jgi:hypothetical protein
VITVAAMRSLPFPFISAVSGVSFRQEIVCACRPGDQLAIVAVDDNPHDPNAIEVRTARGEMCGFIPAGIAPRLRASGQRAWQAEIAEVLAGETWGLRIRVTAPLASGADDDASAGIGDAPPRAEAHAAPVVGGDACVEISTDDVATTVRAKSGRLLGTLLRYDDNAVIVASVGGGECRYPAAVVLIGAPVGQ